MYRLISKVLQYGSCCHILFHIKLINANSHLSQHKGFMTIAFVLSTPRLSLLLAPFPKHLS